MGCFISIIVQIFQTMGSNELSQKLDKNYDGFFIKSKGLSLVGKSRG